VGLGWVGDRCSLIFFEILFCSVVLGPSWIGSRSQDCIFCVQNIPPTAEFKPPTINNVSIATPQEVSGGGGN
jgi:hypothetical protein